MKNSFGERLLLAFNGAKQVEIAERLNITPTAVRNYLSGRIPDGDKLHQISEETNVNIHWLITGEGPSEIQTERTVPLKREFDPLMNRDALAEMIREIVREEMNASAHTQELGQIDAFDLEAAVVRHQNPNTILNKWIKHDGGELRAGDGFLFKGYEEKSTAERMAAITDAKKAIDKISK